MNPPRSKQSSSDLELQPKPEWDQQLTIEIQNQTQGSSPADQPLEEFLKNFNEEVNPPRSLQLTKTQADTIIDKFAQQQKLNINQAKVAISILLQSGGTAKGCDGNLNINIFGQTIKLAYLRKALAEAKCKGYERKLAKFMANDIAMVCTTLKLPGNLTNKIRRLNPDRQFKLEETVWLSDFQVDNEDCPELLRRFISDSFDKKSNTKPQQNQKKTTGK
jgi:hypothetical protein